MSRQKKLVILFTALTVLISSVPMAYAPNRRIDNDHIGNLITRPSGVDDGVVAPEKSLLPGKSKQTRDSGLSMLIALIIQILKSIFGF